MYILNQKGSVFLILQTCPFLLTGTKEVVQLFDFDSLAPITAFKSGAEDCEYKISHTKGFSALELQTGKLRKVGKHTDICSRCNFILSCIRNYPNSFRLSLMNIL